ncbi:helix-turn-helix domain-containing protein [Nocardia sp. NPDC052278]|uniref:helix-turn-helix domain-containing protein n=1 Tax=unclassified Nocardia TaxID=2637762 RepID=UPI00367B7458
MDGNAALTELVQLIRARLAVRRMAVLALEQRTGLGHTTVSRALNGRAVPSQRTVALIADALGADPKPWLILRQAAAEHDQPAVELAAARAGVVLDIGAVRPPWAGVEWAEVRFSVSNFTDHAVKLTRLAIEVLTATESTVSQGASPAAPIDEYFMVGEIVPGASEVELLDRHHLLEPAATDGFFLKITAPEAYAYQLQLLAQWHVLGAQDPMLDRSAMFEVEFPARSVAALAAVVRRRRMQQGQEGAAG